jgi:hypothetical protein
LGRVRKDLADEVEVRSFDVSRRFLFTKDLNTTDGSWLGFMDENSAVGDPHFFSNLRNSTKLLLNKAADRHGFITEVDFQEIVDLTHFCSTVNEDMVLT